MINNIDLIEEEKMDCDEENEMKEMEEEVQAPVESTNIASEIFNYCMRPFENEDSY